MKFPYLLSLAKLASKCMKQMSLIKKQQMNSGVPSDGRFCNTVYVPYTCN